jgi:O-acetyl-ADP-ribose deacetylase (regulator of RNase III)
MLNESVAMRAIQSDITVLDVDAIVNAANSLLIGGGGVDRAIHEAAGPELLKACRLLGGCDTGDAKVTAGFGLKARYIIHAVGPIWHGGNRNEAELLESCYRRSLQLAVAHNVASIAFPSISTGAYAFPLARAAPIAIRTIRSFLMSASSLREVVLCCHSRENLAVYCQLLEEEHA